MDSLGTIIKSTSSNCSLLCASRAIDIVKLSFAKLSVKYVMMESQQVDEDIGQYVRAHLVNDPDLADFRDDIKRHIEQRLVDGAMPARQHQENARQQAQKRQSGAREATRGYQQDIPDYVA
jgi:hypothetical protein